MPELIDMAGQELHGWTVLRYIPSGKGAKWECQHTCGAIKTILGNTALVKASFTLVGN